MMHPLLNGGRFLFIVDECEHCMIWKEFIEKINSELEMDKRIRVKDCTRFHDFKVTDDSIINLFAPYINGEYPVLFIGGMRKDGTNTRLEAESWIRAKLYKDFIFHQNNPYLWNKKCSFMQKGIFKKKIVCN